MYIAATQQRQDSECSSSVRDLGPGHPGHVIRKVNVFSHIPGFIPDQGEDLSEFDKSQNHGKATKVFVGIMAASPMGQGGVAEFEDLEYRRVVRSLV